MQNHVRTFIHTCIKYACTLNISSKLAPYHTWKPCTDEAKDQQTQHNPKQYVKEQWLQLLLHLLVEQPQSPGFQETAKCQNTSGHEFSSPTECQITINNMSNSNQCFKCQETAAVTVDESSAGGWTEDGSTGATS